MTKKMLLVFLCFMLFLSIPGCKKKLPTSPDIPAIILQSIAVISSSDLLYIGISETFTATATMSDGSIKAVVGGVWSGDNPSVATVGASTGQVNIVGSGMVNIFVNYEGKQGSKAIRGLPNYQGTWSGSYVIISCNATGDFILGGFCDGFAVGTEWPTDLVLTQIEDQVTGRFYLGALSADAIGPVQTDGLLMLTGLVTSDPFTIDVLWQAQSTTPGQITGTLDWLVLASSYSGDARVSCRILSLNRTSTMAMAQPTRHVMTPTLQDLIRALLRR